MTKPRTKHERWRPMRLIRYGPGSLMAETYFHVLSSGPGWEWFVWDEDAPYDKDSAEPAPLASGHEPSVARAKAKAEAAMAKAAKKRRS